MADAPEFDDNEPIAPLAQQSKPAAPEFDDNEPIEPLGGAPAPIAPALTAQQRYRQSLKGYHDQGTENPDVAPGYVSPETSKAFAEAKSNTSSLGSQWGDVGIGAAKGLAGGVSGGWLGDIESIGRLPFQIPGVRENIADVSPHTAIPTSEEGGYLGPRGLGAFNAPETPEEKGGAFIGSMLSPNVFSGGAKAVGKGIKHIAGQATFVGPKALEIAYSAGKEGGEAAQAFRENITKSVDLADIIPEVKSSIDNMRAARNAGYVSDMKELGKNVTPLNFDEIDKAVARSTQVKTFKGQDLSPTTTKIRQEMNDAIKEWRSLDPEVYHTPVGMDALKQKLGDLMENILPGTPERVVASDIYNAVRQTIIKEAPEYAPIMKAYENSSAQIKEIEKALSLGKNASADTGLRKLQSILRDNVNASYGSREQLAKYLIANGSPHLMEKLAGQSLSPYTPRGLGKLAQNVGAHMVAIAAAASTGGVAPILTFMAGVTVSSPRLMGNLSYLSGVAARYGEKIPAKAAIRTGILADTVTPDGTQPRATGGSVFDKMHAAKHMQEGGGLESFIKSLGSQGAAFGTQTEQEQAGFQRDPISELGKGAYNALEHLAKENIDNANLLATGNRDQFSGKPGFEAGMLTMGTGAVAGVPMRAGEFALGSGPIKRAVLEQSNAPTFYSALDRAVADIPQAKAPAEQWAATLANRPGVKPEEIQWRGLDQYLAGRQGQTVTKQEIADHLAGNKVELGKVTKGEFSSSELDAAAVKARETGNWAEYDRLLNQAKSNETSNTKYHSYQLPGGENYKETLLTLPEKDPAGYKFIVSPVNGKTKVIDAEGRDMGNWNNREDAVKAFRRVSDNYTSPHWDEPNPVTHMRTNERTIGNTASHHIEEVQSDWHQKGRTEGYKVDAVPDAPFKKTWPDLTMKQALRDAVENGKDRLSWTPGEAQAKRYDLSQQVDSVHYNPDTQRLVAKRGNSNVIDQNSVPPDKLADYVGKDVARKIMGEEPNVNGLRSLRGENLKVGGEGMNEFYDKMLPKAVEKLGKAYGVKVQRGVDTTGNPVNYVDIPPAWKQEILKKGFPLFASGGSVFDKMQNGGVPLPTPSPRMENYNAANVEMDLTPEEQALYQRHLSNLYGTGGVDNQNGTRSTLYQSVQQRPDGKYYNVPTVWDGKIETEKWTRPADGKVFDVPNAVAKQNIGNAGWASFPSYATPDEADTRYDQMHRYMEKDTNQYQKKKGGSVFDKMKRASK